MSKKLTLKDFRVLPNKAVYVRGEEVVVTTPKKTISLQQAIAAMERMKGQKSAERFLELPAIKRCFSETKTTFVLATDKQVALYEKLKLEDMKKQIAKMRKELGRSGAVQHRHEREVGYTLNAVTKANRAYGVKKRELEKFLRDRQAESDKLGALLDKVAAIESAVTSDNKPA